MRNAGLEEAQAGIKIFRYADDTTLIAENKELMTLLMKVIHTVKGFGIVNKAEIDVFLEFSCFFDDPVDVGNLISGSPAFLQSA